MAKPRNLFKMEAKEATNMPVHGLLQGIVIFSDKQGEPALTAFHRDMHAVANKYSECNYG